MVDLRISGRAARDLEDIAARGLSEFGYDASTRYMAGFQRLFVLLRTHPLIGEARPEWGRGIRTLSHRPYRLLHRTTRQQVLIVGVVHMSRDVRRALRSRP